MTLFLRWCGHTTSYWISRPGVQQQDTSVGPRVTAAYQLTHSLFTLNIQH